VALGPRTCLGGAGLHPELGLRLALLTDLLLVLASVSRQTLQSVHNRFFNISSNLLLTNDRLSRVFATDGSLK